MIALTRSQAYEWGQFGIRAVAIAPTVIETAAALLTGAGNGRPDIFLRFLWADSAAG